MLQVFTLVLLAPAILRPVCASLSEQIAFSTGWDQKKAAPKSTYDQVIEQFSAESVENHHLLHSRFLEQFPNDTVTVTSEYGFQLLPFAASSANQLIVKEKDDVRSLKQLVFKPAHRRRAGGSDVYESVKLAGYDVEWRGQELQAFIVAWTENYRLNIQWHIVGDPIAAQQMIRQCCAWSAQPQDVVWVYDQGYWRSDRELWSAVQKASWENVILEEEFKAALINDYRSFFKSEDNYSKFEVPWKRGLILLGPPGNGKTISVKAIMRDVHVPILYVKSFHNFRGDEYAIRDIFERARAEAPCVLVLEDLDSLITELNRSFFLNEVDGLEENDGLLLIGTTNHFDRLDPALSNRPSRFDRKYAFPNPTRAERRQFAVYWQTKLKKNEEIVFPNELLDTVADESAGFSFAYLQESFVSSLLTLAGIDKPRDRPDFASILTGQIKKLRKQLDAGQEQTLSNATTHTAANGMSGGFRHPWMDEEKLKESLQIPAGQVMFGGVL